LITLSLAAHRVEWNWLLDPADCPLQASTGFTVGKKRRGP
jgi:hypothetical protein